MVAGGLHIDLSPFDADHLDLHEVDKLTRQLCWPTRMFTHANSSKCSTSQKVLKC